MQEDFNVWPPPPKGQAPPPLSPPIRPPLPPALRRLGREALVFTLVGVMDLTLMFTGISPNRFFSSASFFSDAVLWLDAAIPFVFLGVYKGWRARAAWTGKVALVVGGILLVPYVPLFIGTLMEAWR